LAVGKDASTASTNAVSEEKERSFISFEAKQIL
jgi:hypothetical protein